MGGHHNTTGLVAVSSPEGRRRNLTLLSCDPETPEPMKDAAVSAAPGPVVEPPQSFLDLISGQRMIMKR